MIQNMLDAWRAIRPDLSKALGAAAGALFTWFTGLTPIAQALLIVQGADVLTGLLLAFQGRSSKSASGKVSSAALSGGVVKKGLEWLVVGVCVFVGGALNMQGISGAAMTYMIAAELVSLMENLSAFGLKIPMLEQMLDAAQGAGEKADAQK